MKPKPKIKENMLKATLRKADSGPTGTQVVDVQAAVSPEDRQDQAALVPIRQNTPRVISFENDSDGAIVGEFTEDDFRLPQLKVVNGNGPLSKQHLQGTLLLKGKPIVASPAALKNGETYSPLKFVPIKVVKEFRENLSKEEMDDGLRARVVPTYEEALRIGGGWVGYRGSEKGRWSASGQIWMLLQEPPNCDHPAFGRMLDGKNYAGCVLYTSGRAYNSAFRDIMDAAGGILRIGGKRILHAKFWSMRILLQGEQNPSYVPVVEVHKKEDTGTELCQYVAELRGKAQVEEGSEE